MISLSSWCLVIVLWLFLAVPWVCLQFVIVVFPDHTHYFSVCSFSFWTCHFSYEQENKLTLFVIVRSASAVLGLFISTYIRHAIFLTQKDITLWPLLELQLKSCICSSVICRCSWKITYSLVIVRSAAAVLDMFIIFQDIPYFMYQEIN